MDDLGSSLVRVTQPNDTVSSMTALSATFQRATLIQSQSPKSAREGKVTHQKTRRQQEMQAALKYFKDEPIATTTTTTTTATARGPPPTNIIGQREEEKQSAEKKVMQRSIHNYIRCLVTGLFTCICVFICMHIYVLYVCMQICTYITTLSAKKGQQHR